MNTSLPSLLLTFFVAFLISHNKAYAKKSIHIENGILELGPPLAVRCQSKDTDFGNRTLLPGQGFGWTFRRNIFGKTLYYCHFWWAPLGDKRFDVYDEGTYGSKSLWWKVEAEGFYMCDHPPSDELEWQRIHKW